MALLDEIISWSLDLKDWQQDALRRLFVNEKLATAELDDLILMVKELHGEGAVSPVRPEPLAQHHISGAGSGATVQLVGMSDLTHVNGFPTGRSVEFVPTGLTVLFGENGTGKSGYARVLKNACRARRREDVQPNAFGSTTGGPQIPSAVLTVLVDGNAERVAWIQSGASDSNLSMISVYDAACAEDYIEEEGTPAFQPYGLGQLNRLATAQREMQRRVATERDGILLNPRLFESLHGATSVGSLISNLGADTDVNDLRRLGTLSPDESARTTALDQALVDLNPEPKALALDRLAERLSQAAQRAHQAQRHVTADAIENVKELLRVDATARGAYETAQQQLRGADQQVAPDALLPGTGNAIWKTLFEAAERFSTSDAYPEHQFPHTEDAAKCVLCQTELSPDARTRMQRFAAFVVDRAATNATDAATALSDALRINAGADFAPLDGPTLTELSTSDPALHARAIAVGAAWTARWSWLKDAVTFDEWTSPVPPMPLGDALGTQLEGKVAILQSQAATLRRSVDPSARVAMEAELGELKARQRLAVLLPQAEQFVTDSALRQKLDRTHAALNPQGVSTKMTNLARTYVTAALADAMNQELKALGYHRQVHPDLTGRTDVGTTKVVLRLKDSTANAHKVLSEGEQRAMAMALFLAEIRSLPHQSSVIFDDPSTSLDHRYRRRMAQRLVALSAERQVLVMTHDAVFLTELHHALRSAEQTASYKTIEWDAAPGRVMDGLTWETMDSKMRLAGIERLAKAIKEDSCDYVNDASAQRIAEGYGKLRGTIERAVREELMNNTVQPFSNVVSVESFGAVIGHPQDEWDAIIEIYDRACEAIEAHDTPAEHQLPLPEAEQLLSDLTTTCDLIAKASVRRKAFEKQRSARNASRKKPFQPT